MKVFIILCLVALASAYQRNSINYNAIPQHFRGPYTVTLDDDDDHYLFRSGLSHAFRSAFPNFGYRRYSSVDLSQVDFNARTSGHPQYIRVPDDDMSGELELYHLVGTVPSGAVSGAAATTYSANMPATVPIYREVDDDDDDDDDFFRFMNRGRSPWTRAPYNYGVPMPTPTTYSGQGARSNIPFNVRVETTRIGNSFGLLLDD